MDKAKDRNTHVMWEDLCRDDDYRGRWVALDDVRYENGTPVEGNLVDVDADLAALCARVQGADHTSCAILFCDDAGSGIRRAMLPT
jgi:hypothetical protein